MDPITGGTQAARRIHDRLRAIAVVLADRPDALGLLALGSAGRENDRLDAWSDLDFFVLVRDGAKGRYVDDLSWLAAAHPVAWSFRNTRDGHKALLADGLFCEFAVFELGELKDIPYAPGRFVWRRDEVAETLAAPSRPLPGRPDLPWLIGEALSNLLVGLQRFARGEKLAAMRMVQVHALDRVLELLELLGRDAVPAAAPRDPFNVDRRVEQRRPHADTELATWAPGYDGTRAAALALLDALEASVDVPDAIAARIRAVAAGVP